MSAHTGWLWTAGANVPRSYNVPAQVPHRGKDERRSFARCEEVDEVGDLFVDLASLPHELGDLLVGVHDGGVVAITKDVGDGRIAVVGKAAEEVHSRLPGGHEGTAPAGATESAR